MSARKYIVYNPIQDNAKLRACMLRQTAEDAVTTLAEVTSIGCSGFRIYELVPVEEVVVTTRTLERIEE